MQKYWNTVQDEHGNPRYGATVSVQQNGSTVTLYSDATGTATKTNPLTTDATRGYFDFYAPAGEYDLVVTGVGFAAYTIAKGAVVGGEPSSPEDFGCVGDGVTDDSVNMRKAIAALKAQGGGTLKGTPGKTYYLNTTTRITGDFGSSGSFLDVHLYLQNTTEVHLDFMESLLQSGTTGGGAIILLDGCLATKCHVRLTSPFAHDAATGNVTVTGQNGVQVANLTQDSFDLDIKVVGSSLYGAVVCDSAATSSYRTRKGKVDVALATGEYGFQCAENFDDVQAVIHTRDCFRSYFVYGVDGHDVFVFDRDGKFGNPILIKAYAKNTTSIRIFCRIVNRWSVGASSGGVIAFQSEHTSASQPTPCTVSNVSMFMDDTGCFANDGIATSHNSIGFGYIKNGVLTGTVATTIFDNITISGIASSEVDSAVVQTPVGKLDISGLNMSASSIKAPQFFATLGASNIQAMSAVAFPPTQIASTNANTLDDYAEALAGNSWTPVITFGTPGDLSVSYTTQIGTYIKTGRQVTVQFNILTSAFTFTTASGSLLISGLPFTVNNVTGTGGRGTCSFGGFNAKVGYTQVNVTAGPNSTTLGFNASGFNSGIATLAATDITTGATMQLVGTITYWASA